MIAQYLDPLDLGTLTASRAVLDHFDRLGTRLFEGINDFFLDRQRPPQDQQFANVLHDAGTQFIGQLLQHGGSGVAVIDMGADFDEAMGVEGCIDFADHGGRQAIRSNGNHRLQVVGLGAKLAALGGG